jgi:hypothetical protein
MAHEMEPLWRAEASAEILDAAFKRWAFLPPSKTQNGQGQEIFSGDPRGRPAAPDNIKYEAAENAAAAR